MCFFFSLIPATVLVVIGYFVLYTSARADGRIGAFGRVLAIWVFVIAMVPPMAGAYVTLSGICPITQLVQ
ncbi:MAG: hypothetical protein OEN55_14615 [Alphaproteobacteria bacterium]|nr:hypothetical protein [Alphaproteobacteria bacterium]